MKKHLNQNGVAHILILLAAIGVIASILILNSASFKDSLLSSLFPKKSSFAAVTVPKYGVFETTYTYTANHSNLSVLNPWRDIKVDAVFTTPSGKTINWPGFYYDVNTFKVRFTPAEVGNYTYTVTITGPSGTQNQSGSFTSASSSNKGFLRRVAGKPTRLMFDDGTFFTGTGFNFCWGQTNGQVTGANLGASFEPAGEGGGTTVDNFFYKFGQEGGFNLFRWVSGGGCSMSITTNLTDMNVTEAKAGDQLLTAAKNNGFEVLMAIIPAFYIVYPNIDTTPSEQQDLTNYYRNILARYGAYVDIWELTNETQDTQLSDAWMTWVTNMVRSVDPYKRLVTNSSPRPNDANYLDVVSPHAYPGWGPSAVLPTVVGEAGFGSGSVWTTNNAFLIRRIDWASALKSIGWIWWNQNYSTSLGQNAYLGYLERVQNKVLMNVMADMKDANATLSTFTNAFSNGNSAEVFIASSPTAYIAYTFTYDLTGSGQFQFNVNVPFAGNAQWIDTRTGAVLGTFAVTAGSRQVTSPTVTQDVVLKILPSGTVSTPTPLPTPTVNPTANPTPTPSSGTQLPYPAGTSAKTIPIKVQAEDYDLGGEGVSYHDTDTLNEGGAYRTSDGVDVENSVVGVNVGWIKSGEWLEYSLNVPTSGNYNLNLRVGSQNSTPGSVKVLFNGVDKTGTVNIPSTGNWQTYQTVTAPVSLTAGSTIMRIEITGGTGDLFNFDYLDITQGTTPTPTPTSIPGDINGSGKVDIFDFNLLLTDFNCTSGTCLRSDINGSGKVDIFDFNLVITNFGRTS